MPSDPVRPGGPRYTRVQRRLLTALAGLVVAALAAGAYVLTYDALRELALAGRVGRRWAPLYPVMADTLVTLTILSLVVARGARWWTRLLRWSLLLLLLAGGAALSVQHSVWGYAPLPGDAVRAGVAVAPHVMLVIAVWLWLTMFKQIRVARPASEETPPLDRRGHVRVLEPSPPPPALEAPEDGERPLIPFPDDTPAQPSPGPDAPSLAPAPYSPARPALAAFEPAEPRSAYTASEHPREPHPAEPGTGGTPESGTREDDAREDDAREDDAQEGGAAHLRDAPPDDAEPEGPPAADGADEWWLSAPREEAGAADAREAGGHEEAAAEPAPPPLDPLPPPRSAPDAAPALLPTDVELVRSRPRDETEEPAAVSDTRPDIVMPGRAADGEEHDAPPPDRAEDPDAEDWNPPPAGNFRSGPTPPAG